MEVHFLGTTGYHPNEDQHTMCVMLPQVGIVFDAGTGMFRMGQHIETPELSILLSHAHLDHVLGLTFLFDVLYQKDCRVQVIGQESKLSALRQHLFSPDIFPVDPPYSDVALEQLATDGRTFYLPSDVRVTFFPVQHPGGAVGYRLDFANGKSLAYVTDTTAEEGSGYEAHVQTVDLLIHECYFPDGHEDRARLTGHSCLTPVVRLAKRVQAKHLVLIHLNPLQQWAPDLADLQEPLDGLQVTIPKDKQVLTF